MPIFAGIPQGNKIGPWLFLTITNDLGIMGLPAEMWTFSDDTTFSEVVLSDGASEMQETVQEITDWTHLNRLQLNPTKCEK